MKPILIIPSPRARDVFKALAVAAVLLGLATDIRPAQAWPWRTAWIKCTYTYWNPLFNADWIMVNGMSGLGSIRGYYTTACTGAGFPSATSVTVGNPVGPGSLVGMAFASCSTGSGTKRTVGVKATGGYVAAGAATWWKTWPSPLSVYIGAAGPFVGVSCT